MRFSLLITMLLFGLCVQAQLTFTGMNGIVMDMSKTAIEKLTQKKIHVSGDVSNVSVILKGAELDIIFHTYSDREQYVYRMSSTSPNLKTAEGIGVGSGLEDIWNAYRQKGLIIIRSKEFDEYGDGDADKSVNFYTKRPDNDGYYNYLAFFLKRDKVFRITIGRTEDPI